MTQVVWSTELLSLLHAPQTPANYRFLNAWAQREHNGGPALSDGSNNPFFTTAGGSSTVGPLKSGTFPYWNPIGVARYPNLSVGVFANAYHISSGYPAIRDALRSGNPAAQAGNPEFQRELTRWSGSGYSSLASVPGAAGPVGPTVDPAAVGKAVTSALLPGSGGSGVAGDVAGAINDAARHIPGVAQAEGVAQGAVSVAGFLAKLTDPHYILRGLQIVAGAALVGIGAVLLARQVALAADLPDPASFAGPIGRGASSAASAAASQTPARRDARRAEDAHRASTSKPAREGTGARRSASVDADTGMTRAQAREARSARRQRTSPSDEIPF